jgi:hypothetical protein
MRIDRIEEGSRRREFIQWLVMRGVFVIAQKDEAGLRA